MKTMIRFLSLLMAVCILFCCTACGEDSSSGSSYAPAQGDGTDSSQTHTEAKGAGFSANHAFEAGLGMGMDTLDDIIGRYGQPLEYSTDEYTSITVSYAVYDFGRFEFEGAPGTDPVLTYVQIYSQYLAPCGIDFGADIEDAANLIYTGSGDGLKSASEQQRYFYGDDSAGTEYGRYTMLTIEFISSATNDTYALEYRADSYDEGKMIMFTLYFNAEYNMTWYSVRYV